jgi:hypothetical protein
MAHVQITKGRRTSIRFINGVLLSGFGQTHHTPWLQPAAHGRSMLLLISTAVPKYLSSQKNPVVIAPSFVLLVQIPRSRLCVVSIETVRAFGQVQCQEPVARSCAMDSVMVKQADRRGSI